MTEIVGEVTPQRSRQQSVSEGNLVDAPNDVDSETSPVEFELTDEFLAAKREVLRLCL